jgi:hypothetical protein
MAFSYMLAAPRNAETSVKYVHQNGREEALDRDLGWCDTCVGLVPIESLISEDTEMFAKRESSPRCLECGGDNIHYVQLQDQDSKSIGFKHPGCGGEFNEKEHPEGLRLSLVYEEKFYDLEGNRLPNEPVHRKQFGYRFQKVKSTIMDWGPMVFETIRLTFLAVFVLPFLLIWHAISPAYREQCRKNAEDDVMLSLHRSINMNSLRSELKSLKENHKRRQNGEPEEDNYSPHGFYFSVPQ